MCSAESQNEAEGEKRGGASGMTKRKKLLSLHDGAGAPLDGGRQGTRRHVMASLYPANKWKEKTETVETGKQGVGRF